jgi:hypothetical protein
MGFASLPPVKARAAPIGTWQANSGESISSLDSTGGRKRLLFQLEIQYGISRFDMKQNIFVLLCF